MKPRSASPVTRLRTLFDTFLLTNSDGALIIREKRKANPRTLDVIGKRKSVEKRTRKYPRIQFRVVLII